MALIETASPQPAGWSRRTAWLAGFALVAATVAAYANSLNLPFFFDDQPGIVLNGTLRQWPSWETLVPPQNGSGASGRPLVNFTFALNYALGELDVRGYHATNIALHLLAALTLWGVLRRTLRRIGAVGGDQTVEWLAWSAALLWAVHPLLTESIVCVIQRNEIMGGLFYLLTLYCFIRGAETGVSSKRWLALSFVACLAGLASKELVATAPLLVFLYDRTFVAGTFRTAWQQRRRYYLALVATWLPLALLVWSNQQRGGTVGFGVGVSSWDYLLTQCRALVLYLKLSIWPHPLVVDYGWPLSKSIGEVWWQGLVVLALLAGTFVALVRKPMVGFLGAWFFVILAPSSSFIPLATQTIAEHRMYLPLAAIVTAAVLAFGVWLGRRAVWVSGVLALGFVGLTLQRNTDYRTEVGIWTNVIARCPDNPRGHGNLGRAYLTQERWEEALVECREELRLDPKRNGFAHVNIGRALTGLGRPGEALPHLEEGLKFTPDSFETHNHYGVALAALGRWSEAVPHYERALQLQPDLGDVHNNLANSLAKIGRVPEALTHYAEAVRLQPDFTEAEVNWARTLAEAGRVAEAVPHFEKVIRKRPQNAEARHDLAVALAASGRLDDAVPHFDEALRLQPDSAAMHFQFAVLLGQLHRWPEAIKHDEAALRLQPDLAEAREHLEWLRLQ